MSAATEIPRLIHRVWLGPDPLPEEFAHYGETWRRHHPEWEIRLWTDADLDELPLPDAFSRARDHVERSDVLRLELIRAIGGVYVDTDVECRRPIDPLLDGVTAFAAHQRPQSDIVNNAVMGAVPHHPAFEQAIEEIERTVGTGGVLDSTGPHFLTPILGGRPDVTIFGHEKFHPYYATEPHRRDEDFPEAYAVHHWSGHWKTREFYEAQSARHRARIRRLQARVGALKQKRRRHRARIRHLQASVGALKQKRRRARARLSAAELRIAELERRLDAIESTRWWRLRRWLGRLRRSARR
jgi:mannosyltransferase OCH1-like enzyme